MKSKKYKILVLSDLNANTTNTLKSSIGLAKIVGADINFFYVKKPTEVVKAENQLSAMRHVNREFFSTDKKIKDLISSFSKTYKVKINYKFAFGNVKNEIGDYIDENKPDIIVLGKRKSKMINVIGDNITDFILNKHNTTIVIANDKNVIEPDNDLALGLLYNVKPTHTFAESIIGFSQKPLTSFKIADSSNTVKEENYLTDKQTVEYVFEKSDNDIKNISSYLSKTKINYLFVNREDRNSKSARSNIKDAINNLNCSLILTT
tara:strand:- start:152 stop:940 length:789 start_codon:yes stop_codon:yes gene_type:complete